MKDKKSSFLALSRRTFLTMASLGAIALGLGVGPSASFAAEAAKGQNILIIYFSHSGNTRTIAEQIHSRTGGDIVELKTVQPYPDDYNTTVDMAQKEKTEHARPAITTELTDLAKYDTVFLGFPNWWGTIPMAYYTLLEKYDLGNKIVIPFVTHGGSAFGSSLNDLKRLCPKARFKEGLAVRGSRVKSAQKDVDKWLSKLGLASE
ncbi:MAG: flavodoxin [Desulfovibrionaceae bacterium]|nr:flavodoxin [Desulfovibrionaceae bacterium]